MTTCAPRWIGLIVLAFALICPVAARAADVVKMGELPSISNVGLSVTIDKGYFQARGITVVFAGVVTFGLLGVATTWLLQWLERVGCPWLQRSN